MIKARSYQKKQRAAPTNVYIILTILAAFWMPPIARVILTNFHGKGDVFVPYIIPKTFTLENYGVLSTNQIGNFPSVHWFLNILPVSTASCLLPTFITITMAYVLPRLRFRLRKPFLEVTPVLDTFPGFMSMITVYYILKVLNLTESLFALILVYPVGSALGFYIARGFFDTIPMALGRSAMIDGANKWQIFTKITLLSSRPTIVHTFLAVFMGPWMDFTFVKVVMDGKIESYTVATGLFSMMTKSTVNSLFVASTAGCMLVAIPVTILFILMQRFYVEGVTSGFAKD